MRHIIVFAMDGSDRLPHTAMLIFLIIAVRKGRVSAPEIGRIIGLSTAQVYRHIKVLKERGYVRRKRRGTCWVEAEWELDYQRLQSWLLSGRRPYLPPWARRRAGSRINGEE